MTLFESPSNYREKAAILRLFSLLPLFGGLAAGRMFRWFALNIPMDFMTGGAFTSDVDVIARLRMPKEPWVHKTWEVKVSLLCKDGSARSLKAGKLARTVTQLNAYRAFGSPDVSLLDAYICEAGFMGTNKFPPPSIREVAEDRHRELAGEGFGYQLLPFEHGRDGDDDVGYTRYAVGGNPMQGAFTLARPRVTEPRDPFLRWVKRLDDFFEQAPGTAAQKVFKQIVFCRACRSLGLLAARDEPACCPRCGADLIAQ